MIVTDRFFLFIPVILLRLQLSIYSCYGFALDKLILQSSFGNAGVTNNYNNPSSNENNNWWIEIRPANIPQDLDRIRECRSTAFLSQKDKTKKEKEEQNDECPKFLNSQLSFMNAEAATTNNDTVIMIAKEKLPPFKILGTADIRQKTNDEESFVITNVYVVPYARGMGIAKLLVQQAEKLATLTRSTKTISSSSLSMSSSFPLLNKRRRNKRIELDVETANIPAVNLYQKCAYQAKGMHAIVYHIGKVTGYNFCMTMTKDLSTNVIV